MFSCPEQNARIGVSWMQVGPATLKGGPTISTNAQPLHGATLVEYKIAWSTEPKLFILPYNLPVSSKTEPTIIGN